MEQTDTNLAAAKCATQILRADVGRLPRRLDDVDGEFLCAYADGFRNERTACYNPKMKTFYAILNFLTKHPEPFCLVIGNVPKCIERFFPNIEFRFYESENMYSQKNVFSKDCVNTLPDRLAFFYEDADGEFSGEATRASYSKCLSILDWLRDKKGSYSIKYELCYIAGQLIEQPVVGDLELIPFCSLKSTECRQIGALGAHSPRAYPRYEQKILYLNILVREWARFDMRFDNFDVKNKYGFGNTWTLVSEPDGCFDCALEQVLCDEYERLVPITDRVVRTRGDGDYSVQNYIRYKLYQNPLIHSEIGTWSKISGPRMLLAHHSAKNVDVFFDRPDVIQITIHNLVTLGNVCLSEEDLKTILTRPKAALTLRQAVTHRNVNRTCNYEKLELYGDCVFSACVARFFDSTPTNNIGLLSDYKNYFTSGEVQTTMFASRLRIRDMVVVGDKECLDKTCEDVLEAYIAAICKIFDDLRACVQCSRLFATNEAHGCADAPRFGACGMEICYNIVRSILGAVDLSTVSVFPPKTELMVMLNAYKYNFEDCYSVTHTNNDLHVQEYVVKLHIADTTRRGDNCPVVERTYRGVGRFRKVERAACASFIKHLISLGFVPKIKEKHCGL